MPTYDMQCNRCEYEFEHVCRISELEEATCPECKAQARVIIKTLPAKDWFRPHWNPNFDLNPIYVESKSHYKRLCEKYNVTSHALGDIRNIKEI